MANLDFSEATVSVDMTDPALVNFGAVERATPTEWSFLTSAGNHLDLFGQGMTYDAKGHALSGTVTSMAIDAVIDDLGYPTVTPVYDLVITGIGAPAQTLDDGAGFLWRVLEGNDVFSLPSAPSLGTGLDFTIFGDASETYTGLMSGGSDAIHANGAAAYISGDVMAVRSGEFHGGGDEIDGLATGAQQTLVGDASLVQAGGKLLGGSDSIFIQSTNTASLAVGDAETVNGTSGRRAEVVGGDDYIAAGTGSHARLVGDVDQQLESSLVRGGIDELVGAEQGDFIIGDVLDVGIGKLIGGNDTIWGNGGSDLLIGDAYTVGSSATVVCGNDIIYGGDGYDQIYGDTPQELPGIVMGGDDELHGEAGADLLVGGAGNDALDGGTGDDYMIGGTGNDSYVVDSGSDTTIEGAAQGIDKVLAFVEEYTLPANVENLSSIWIGHFSGVGNALNNTMSAGGGDDYLSGETGNDTLIGLGGNDTLLGGEGSDTLTGGAGADVLDGGAGIDTASYAGATEGVRAALDGLFAGQGDALGDTFASVERLVGSNYRDILRGDANANILTGGAGNDSLQAAGGNDTLIGGAGTDTLSGGLGNDRFDYFALTDGGDTIADFGNAPNNDDTLRFAGAAFGGLPAGALAANRFLASAAGVATTADQRFIYETDTGILRFDADGAAAGGVTVIATLSGAPTLSAGDLVII